MERWVSNRKGQGSIPGPAKIFQVSSFYWEDRGHLYNLAIIKIMPNN